jgi:aminoglycoside phosphotransferase (APT) family kinase protein
MHADELDIDAGLVERLVAEQFPQWAGLPLEPVSSWGTDNALYRLGDELVVRLPRRERTVLTLEKERRWLPVVGPSLPLAIPEPLAEGKPADGYPWTWSLYSWLPGRDATTSRVEGSLGAASDLARFLTALHRIDGAEGPGPGEHNFFRGEPIASRDRAVRVSMDALCAELDLETVTAVWERALAAPQWKGPPVWIHGDLDARNLLVEHDRIVGVIDWGGLGVGDPACDVMVAWKVFSPEARSYFRSELSVDEATATRARGWALSQALNALSYYTLETNPILVGEAKRWLAEVLADPNDG